MPGRPTWDTPRRAITAPRSRRRPLSRGSCGRSWSSRGAAAPFYGGVGLLLAGLDGAGRAHGACRSRCCPFDNKSEFQVILDFPEGTTLETSNAARRQRSRPISRDVPEVRSTEVYAGTSAPFNFNGLVRHYFLRRGANVADVQVNLAPQGRAAAGRATRSPWPCGPAIDSIAAALRASAKIAEIPPGPPVLSTLVAEIYAGRMTAPGWRRPGAVKAVFEQTPGVVDVDWTVEAPQQQESLRVDRVRAAQAGASVEQIAQTVYLALSGGTGGLASPPTAREGTCRSCRGCRLAQRGVVDGLLAHPVATSCRARSRWRASCGGLRRRGSPAASARISAR